MNEDNLEHSVAQNVLNAVLSYYGFDLMMLFDRIGKEYRSRIYDIRKGKTKMMSKPIINALKKVWPDLNEGYLRTGRGEMLITPSAEIKKEEPPTNDMSGVLLHLVSVIHEQSQLISELNKKVSALTLQVAAMQPQPVRPYLFNENEPSAFAADDSKPENQ